MTERIYKEFHVHAADQFVESVSEAANSMYYVFSTKHRPYSEGTTPTPSNAIANSVGQTYDEMQFGKLLVGNDVVSAIYNYDWANGNFYSQYDDTDTTLDSLDLKQYYTVTTEGTTRHVWKCIDNNGNTASTSQPLFSDISASLDTLYIKSGADGFQWRYMYSVNQTDYEKYYANNYLPVIENSNAISNAVHGAIDLYTVTNNGNGYNEFANGTVTSATNTTVFVIQTGNTARPLNTATNYYNNCSIYFTAGSCNGEIATISSWNGATSQIVLTSALSKAPDTSSFYEITPSVVVAGDGSNASARAIINTSTNTVANVEILNRGSRYSHADVTIVGNNASTTATARAIIGPYGGHASNPKEELFARYVILRTEFANNESSNITTDNDFRTVGILKDPHYANVQLNLNEIGATANFSLDENVTFGGNSSGVVTFANTTALRLSNAVGVFSNSANVVGATSTASAIINTIYVNAEDSGRSNSHYFQQTHKFGHNFTSGSTFSEDEKVTDSINNANGFVYACNSTITTLSEVRGTFDTSNTASVTRATSANVARFKSKISPDLVKGSGTVLMLKNITAVSRSNTTTETVKLVIQF